MLLCFLNTQETGLFAKKNLLDFQELHNTTVEHGLPTLVAQTAIAVDFDSELLISRACALSHLGGDHIFDEQTIH